MITARKPCDVSRMDTLRRSPELMNRSFVRSGVNVAVVDCTGFAGAVVRPFLVMNEKLTYSGLPIWLRRVG